jgi:hypothetical protein
MKRLSGILAVYCLTVILALASIPVLKAAGAPAASEQSAAPPQSAYRPGMTGRTHGIGGAHARTTVIADEQSGAIRFMVNGKEQARIDGTGLHVRENVEYGGTITDVGVDSYDKAAHAK